MPSMRSNIRTSLVRHFQPSLTSCHSSKTLTNWIDGCFEVSKGLCPQPLLVELSALDRRGNGPMEPDKQTAIDDLMVNHRMEGAMLTKIEGTITRMRLEIHDLLHHQPNSHDGQRGRPMNLAISHYRRDRLQAMLGGMLELRRCKQTPPALEVDLRAAICHREVATGTHTFRAIRTALTDLDTTAMHRDMTDGVMIGCLMIVAEDAVEVLYGPHLVMVSEHEVLAETCIDDESLASLQQSSILTR